MKYCPKCNEKFETGKFCKFCGGALVEEASTTQELRCTSCGAVLKAGTKFCPKCGTRILVATNNSVIMPADFVKIPAGTFRMGSRRENGYGQFVHVHTVALTKPFEICNHVVTQEEWKAVMGSLPKDLGSGKKPVICVSWTDAVNYCNTLSVKEGRTAAYTVNGKDVAWNKAANGYRLPTEAEWQYAAQGGNDGNKNTDELWTGLSGGAWCIENSGAEIHDIKTKEPNALGLYDMSGNVWEWCWDRYGAYSKEDVVDPSGAPSGLSRVMRGGCYNLSASCCSVSHRDYRNPDSAYSYIGFRVVRSSSEN